MNKEVEFDPDISRMFDPVVTPNDESPISLGETFTYEMWLLRYNNWCLVAEGFESCEEASKFAVDAGLSERKVKIVQVFTRRRQVSLIVDL